MSRNLVELIRRHHSVDAPTALQVLKEAMDDHGELTDADRKRAAEVSGLPEAAVYGVSTFYDDLLAPRGERHVRVCTGTACFAAARETTVSGAGMRRANEVQELWQKDAHVLPEAQGGWYGRCDRTPVHSAR